MKKTIYYWDSPHPAPLEAAFMSYLGSIPPGAAPSSLSLGDAARLLRLLKGRVPGLKGTPGQLKRLYDLWATGPKGYAVHGPYVLYSENIYPLERRAI